MNVKRKTRTKLNHVYVVEMLQGFNWEPCAGIALTRDEGEQMELKEWRRRNPHDKFRLTRYESKRKP